MCNETTSSEKIASILQMFNIYIMDVYMKCVNIYL